MCVIVFIIWAGKIVNTFAYLILQYYYLLLQMTTVNVLLQNIKLKDIQYIFLLTL